MPHWSGINPTVDEIRAKASAAAFGDPLVSNIYRGLVAEIIVGAALGPDWRLCSGDWRGWDFEHAAGCRLEVKQSAARQTWTGSRRATKPIFDIRARTGYFEGADWVADPRRIAEIYVFAHHPVTAPIIATRCNGCSTSSGRINFRPERRSAWRRSWG